MTHQEYTTAIKKQQTLINKLFKSRKERSETIDNLTKERYSELIGKFFKADDRLNGAHIGEYYYIFNVVAQSNYAMSNQVDVELFCRYFGTTQGYWKEKFIVTGLEFWGQSFRFKPGDDIISIIEPMLVSKEEVMNEFEDLKKQLTENFLNID